MTTRTTLGAEGAMPQSVPEQDPPQQRSGLAVIGIGASAGGLDAATRLLDAWPRPADTAFILVQHADPSGGSMLATLLAPHTALSVAEAAEGMPVEAGHLYISPPGRYLSIGQGRLRLSVAPVRHGARMPFDFLLHSLAEQFGARAGCVVLSGTGTDGAIGLASVHAQGGAVAVQDPAEATFAGMPASAVATGLADFILPIAEIPAAMSKCLWSVTAAAPPAVAASAEAPGATPGKGIPDILDLLRTETASDFTLYKPGTLQRRIGRRIVLAGLKPDDIAGYLELLRANPAELQAAARDLLIHVTGFFRDPAVFETLAATTIPDLIASHPAGQPLRVWVAGCSTGEETYSLVMVLLEQVDAAGRRVKLQVFASDVDAEAIATARDGAYPAASLDNVTPARLARFFVREEAGWRAAAELRAAVVFTVQDVLADPPFSRLDMVSCRNLLIYLQPDAQARVLEAFHFGLRAGGILLLGTAESASVPEGLFEVAAKVERIYRRIDQKPAAKQEPQARLASPLGMGLASRRGQPRAPALPIAPMRPAALADLGRRLVMEAYAPASALVDGNNTLLFSLGPTDRYLRMPPGHATQDLLAMARPGLRATLRSALQAARDTREVALDTGWIASNSASQPFSLAVHPVMEHGQNLLLVCFLDAPAPVRGNGEPLPHADRPHIAELQRELDATRTELQGTVRDLELSGEEQRAINEEALSVNEEYQSTNEELVASKEELQSLNEELTAVNSQLQETLERQRTTSDDLQNVLYSTNVATLFLDLEGRIRFFTPAIKALFAIIPNDVGRRLADFAALAPDVALAGDVEAVLSGLEPLDREIEAADGTWFRRRVLPYRTGGSRVEGVVITFSDVSSRKATARALEAAKMAAETANAAKSRFLAAASHDLRQPLQTLALLQDLLADTVKGESAQALVARQTVTLSTVTSMLDTLLDINEIEAGAVQPDVTAFDIGGLLERLGEEFTYHAQAKGLALHVVACRQTVQSDRRLLEQIVRNLLTNAVKYTSAGRILLGCRRHGSMLSVEVLDTGIGLENTDLTSIFEEYYQVDNVARQRSHGLGLGLSIVKRLGDLLGHAIRVRSRPGVGSMFAIDLPWLPKADAVPVAPPPATGQSDRVHRILVVEDDPDVGEMLKVLLVGEGHSLTTAVDGPSALETLSYGTPDLVITDYNLPNGPNGLELARLIRTKAGRPMPVLILTGDISAGTLRAVAAAGCTLLTKPVGLHTLRETIARLLVPPRSTGQPTVFVVDDDNEVRDMILAVLHADGRAATGYPSAEAFLMGVHPDTARLGSGDCLLVDAALPGISGIELLEQLRAAGHSVPVIVVTGQSDVSMAIRAMKAGAADFIEKPVNRAILLTSLAHALEGSMDVAKRAARHDAAAAHVAGLTVRQREIMTLVLAGHPSKNIAADLGISQRTVENHRASIMHKTGTRSLPALARLALDAGSATGALSRRE